MENLEKLAAKIGDSFLEIFHSNSEYVAKNKTIGLYGADEDTLENLKNKMETYFKSKEEEVNIVFGDKGYPLDVGWCLRSFPNKVH